MLNLKRQVPGHEVQGGAAGDIGRTQHLAQVPLATGLALDGGFREGLDAFGKVPAHDHRVRPEIADEVGGEIRRQGGQRRGPRQQRMQHVVAGGVAADFGQHLLAAGTEVGLVDATLEELADLEVVGGDPVLEETGVDGVRQRLD